MAKLIPSILLAACLAAVFYFYTEHSEKLSEMDDRISDTQYKAEKDYESADGYFARVESSESEIESVKQDLKAATDKIELLERQSAEFSQILSQHDTGGRDAPIEVQQLWARQAAEAKRLREAGEKRIADEQARVKAEVEYERGERLRRELR
jgi:hypothetical protein